MLPSWTESSSSGRSFCHVGVARAPLCLDRARLWPPSCRSHWWPPVSGGVAGAQGVRCWGSGPSEAQTLRDLDLAAGFCPPPQRSLCPSWEGRAGGQLAAALGPDPAASPSRGADERVVTSSTRGPERLFQNNASLPRPARPWAGSGAGWDGVCGAWTADTIPALPPSPACPPERGSLSPGYSPPPRSSYPRLGTVCVWPVCTNRKPPGGTRGQRAPCTAGPGGLAVLSRLQAPRGSPAACLEPFLPP